jgi:YegS/Rv2252/BmrU family lipid kinase
MAMEADLETLRVFVIVNTKSGNASPQSVKEQLGDRWTGRSARLTIYEPAEGDDITSVARQATAQGFNLVVAAGGDGTISAVANGLLGSSACLGIIPLGTANVLARELGIPLSLDRIAMRRVDAMKVGERCYFTQIGIGLDALMIRDTKTEHKKRLGNAAYLWNATKRLLGFQPHRFSISSDGKKVRPRAAQVLLANCGTVGFSPYRWGPDVCAEDGRLDVCILRGRTVLDYAKICWSILRGKHREERNIKYLTATRVVAIHADAPLLIHGDGEVIGETPIEVRVVPGALNVAVPVIDCRT